MNLLRSLALTANPQCRDLDSEQALQNLMGAKVIILEMFQSVPGQLLLEYLVAMAEVNKDQFFDSKNKKDEDLPRLEGYLDSATEIVGLVDFLKRYNVAEKQI